MAVYSHRDDPPGIAASISDDFGRTWDRSRDLMIYDSSAGTEPGARERRSQKEKFDDMRAWRFGHPRGGAAEGRLGLRRVLRRRRRRQERLLGESGNVRAALGTTLVVAPVPFSTTWRREARR